jgi:hypothetical protein
MLGKKIQYAKTGLHLNYQIVLHILLRDGA